MIDSLLTLEAWDATSSGEKNQVARHVELAIGARARFERLQKYALGGQEHTIAMFESGAIQLALLPGYRGPLGYHTALHPLPIEVVEEWRAATSGPPKATFDEFLHKVVTPWREVTLAPFLIATHAEPLERMERLPNGALLGGPPIDRTAVLMHIAAAGFRFPTSDEWEYAYSGGSMALFRWGDVWPSIEWTPVEQRPTQMWQDDLKPNAFGVHIAENPWNSRILR